MGDFTLTCGVSRLPIAEGARVVHLFLNTDRYHNGWHVRSLPVHGHYVNYGQFGEFEGSEIARTINAARFAHDLVEVGVGDNQVHDHEVRVGMLFGEYADRIDRVRVRFARSQDVVPAPSGLALFREHLGQIGFTDLSRIDIDEVSGDHYRIRTKGYPTDTEMRERLDLVKSVLDPHYACVVTRGGGAYANTVELHVMPAPHNDKAHGWGRVLLSDDATRTCPVANCLVLESVWEQLAVANMGAHWDSWKRKPDAHKAAIAQLWQDLQQLSRLDPREIDFHELRGDLPRALPGYKRYEGPMPHLLVSSTQSRVSYPNSVCEHLFEAAAAHAKTPWPEMQVRELLHDVEYLWRIWENLKWTRHGFAPSGSAGPQYPEYRDELVAHRIYGRVLREAIANQKALMRGLA